MRKWRPIETMPKDYTSDEVLVYAGRILIAYWDHRANLFLSAYEDLDEDEQPTHWMPMPEPPEVKP